ncbi:hypothetical protein ACIPRI_00920 [Variovorax sp. LARHSF232]
MTETRSTCPYCGVGCAVAYGPALRAECERRSLSIGSHG